MDSEDEDDLVDMDDSDDDDDDDESGDEEAGASAGAGANKKSFVGQLREDLQNSPFDAELHAALVSALRENADLDKLRNARLQAAARIALPESLWLEWLQDEARLAGDDDLEELDALHRRSCAACPTSQMWLARCALHRERSQNVAQMSEVRAVYEEAISILGLHPTDGPELWADYREFEEGLLASATGEKAQQAQRVRTLFMRQLALPLPGADRLKEAHATFEGSLEPSLQSKTAAAKAAALARTAADLWGKREVLEQKLIEASRPAMVMVAVSAAGTEDSKAASPADVSEELLRLEEASGDKARIFAGHLRATQWAPKDFQRWQRFANFASGEMKDHAKAAEVLERSVRRCPRCAELWLQLHLEYEASGATLAVLRDAKDRGILAMSSAAATDTGEEHAQQAGLSSPAAIKELLLQHADAARRAASSGSSAPEGEASAWAEMRQTLEQAAAPQSNPKGQRASSEAKGADCETLLHWMKLEAYAACDLNATLSVGRRLMQQWGISYNAWSAFLAAARHCAGDKAYGTVRELYRNALSQVVDYPSQVRSDYVQFERECGTLDSWLEAKKQSQPEQATSSPPAQKEKPKDAKNSLRAGAKEPAKQVQQPAAAKREAPKAKSTPAKRRQVLLQANLADKQLPTLPDQKVNDTPASSSSATSASSSFFNFSDTPASSSSATSASSNFINFSDDTPASSSSAPQASPAPTGPVLAPEASAAPASISEPKAAAAELEVKGKESEVPEHGKAPLEAQTEQAAAAPKKNEALQQALLAAAAAKEEGKDKKEKEKEKGKVKGKGKKEEKEEKEVKETQEEEEKAEPHKGSHFHQRRLAERGAEVKPEDEGKHTVYVANLDWSVDEAHLSRIFGEVDGLKEVRLVKDYLSRSKGYAYIDFETTAQVTRAVKKMDGKEVNKRALKVAPSLPTKVLFEEKTIFVRDIGASATESDVKEAFASKGEVLSVRMPAADDSGKVTGHKGYAYVEFTAAESVEAALSSEELTIGGQVVQISRSIPMKDHRHQTAANRKDIAARSNQKAILTGKEEREDLVKQAAKCPTTVYVKNLAFTVTDEILKKHFETCGKVEQVLICRNCDGNSRGFGFVEFAEANEAQSALLLSDSELCEREIVVSKSSRAITVKLKNKDKEDVKIKTRDKEDHKESADQASGKGKSKDKSQAKDKGNDKGKLKDKGADKGKGKGKGDGKEGKGKGKDKDKGKDKTQGKGDKSIDAEGPEAKGPTDRARRRLNLGGPEQSQEEDKTKRPRTDSAVDGEVPDSKRACQTTSSASDAAAPSKAPAEAPQAAAPARPMSNADFRKLMLSGGT